MANNTSETLSIPAHVLTPEAAGKYFDRLSFDRLGERIGAYACMSMVMHTMSAGAKHRDAVETMLLGTVARQQRDGEHAGLEVVMLDQVALSADEAVETGYGFFLMGRSGEISERNIGRLVQLQLGVVMDANWAIEDAGMRLELQVPDELKDADDTGALVHVPPESSGAR